MVITAINIHVSREIMLEKAQTYQGRLKSSMSLKLTQILDTKTVTIPVTKSNTVANILTIDLII